MTDYPAVPWRRRMRARDAVEPHRAATPLELFYDLCFVVAVAAVSHELHHAETEGHLAFGLLGYLPVFFTIWWAWMNFTWFASAYDPDDTPYRLCVLVQILGVLILSAGVAPAFAHGDFRAVFAGYVVMRIGLETQRLRAARADPSGRRTMRRYVAGESTALLGWAVVVFTLTGAALTAGFVAMAVVELLVPVWAEVGRRSPWHPHHIAERFGLFTLIVMGESVAAATTAVAEALGDRAHFDELATLTCGGLLIVFSMWWLYFALPAHELLTSVNRAFVWGYGHYVIFASVAAAGVGLAAHIDVVTGDSALTGWWRGGVVAVPVALYLWVLWALQMKPREMPGRFQPVLPVAGVVVLASAGTPEPVLATGVVTAVVTGGAIVVSSRSAAASGRAGTGEAT